MNKKFGNDLTTGSIPKHLLMVAVPMLVSNFLQVTYTMADAMWVGRFEGEVALAAIGQSFPILFLLIALASGATIATTILVAQFYGAKNMTMVENVVNTSFTFSTIFGLVMSILSILLCDSILKIMRVPPEVLVVLSPYLKISLAGFVFTYLSFLITSILRGIGDTITPLIFMAIGSFINITLDPLLIIGVGPFPKLGINGAAVASLTGNIIAFLAGMIYLNHKNHLVSFHPKNFKLDFGILSSLFKIGFPSSIQQTLVSLNLIVMTFLVNGFGKDAATAFAAAGRVDSIAFMPAMSLGMAASALAGQNLGAKKPERVKEILFWGVLMTVSITLVISAFVNLFPNQLFGLFGIESGSSVTQIGTTYIHIVGASYVFFSVMFIIAGIINGSGHTLATLLISIFSLWIFRIPLAVFLSNTSLGIQGVWIALAIGFFLSMGFNIVYYMTGKWKVPVIRQMAKKEA